MGSRCVFAEALSGCVSAIEIWDWLEIEIEELMPLGPGEGVGLRLKVSGLGGMVVLVMNENGEVEGERRELARTKAK
jgi:hypothetical protein